MTYIYICVFMFVFVFVSLFVFVFVFVHILHIHCNAVCKFKILPTAATQHIEPNHSHMLQSAEHVEAYVFVLVYLYLYLCLCLHTCNATQLINGGHATHWTKSFSYFTKRGTRETPGWTFILFAHYFNHSLQIVSYGMIKYSNGQMHTHYLRMLTDVLDFCVVWKV